MGCMFDRLPVVVVTALIFDPPPHSIRSLDNWFRFRVYANFCLAIYKPDGRHPAEQILFYRVTPIWDIFRRTMDLLFIVVHFFCHVDEYAVHLSHLVTSSHLSSNLVGTLERQCVRDICRISAIVSFSIVVYNNLSF